MMQFDSARWMQDSGGVWLCLHVTAPAAAKEFCGTMQPKLYDADLKVHREKRSLDANAYHAGRTIPQLCAGHRRQL